MYFLYLSSVLLIQRKLQSNRIFTLIAEQVHEYFSCLDLVSSTFLLRFNKFAVCPQPKHTPHRNDQFAPKPFFETAVKYFPASKFEVVRKLYVQVYPVSHLINWRFFLCFGPVKSQFLTRLEESFLFAYFQFFSKLFIKTALFAPLFPVTKAKKRFMRTVHDTGPLVLRIVSGWSLTKFMPAKSLTFSVTAIQREHTPDRELMDILKKTF